MLAGMAAGLINAVVGSGTLVTFPTLLAFGVPPVVANTSNSVGLVAGGISGTWSMLPELRPQKRRLLRLGLAGLLGGTTGALLLLSLPSAAFKTIVPVLIGLGCVLVIVQPWLSKRVSAKHSPGDTATDSEPLWLWFAVVGSSIYGGYFGAAQGVLMLAILGIGLPHDSMARINAVKNGVVTLVNLIAAVIFILISHINWWAALAVALGSIVGAMIGARIGRKLPATLYRVVIVTIGVIAIINLVMT